MTNVEILAPGVIPPDDAADQAIVVRNLTKRYGNHLALDDVSVAVPAGSVCGLVGPNGAGKSTLMSIVATLVRPTAGAVSVFGHRTSSPKAVRGLVGYVPDVLGTYSGLSVEEYLTFFADAYRIDRDERGPLVDGLLELVDLTTKRDADVNTLSRGMKQRIGLARGLIHQPKLLVLDEPASGLDPRARVDLRDIILELHEMGVTVLISSHILSELEEMCSHALVLEQGRLVGFEDLSVTPARIVAITFAGGAREEYPVADEAEQLALVRRLVTEGRDVLTVTEVESGLEERFLRLTKGDLN